MDKPEALRLADALDYGEFDVVEHGQHAAAELRRLYDLAYKYKWQVIDMLEVLKLIDGATVEGGTINNMARAVIARAEGDTNGQT